MSIEALDFDVAQSGGWKDPSRHIDCLRKRRIAMQLVNRRPPHHAFHLNERTHGWHKQRVARLQSFNVGAHAAQEQVIQIDLLHQCIPAIVLHNAHRSA